MLEIMSNRNRRMLASCLGTLLLFILLLLASLEVRIEMERPLKIRTHEVRMYKPPPPPPPPPMKQSTQDSPMPSLAKASADEDPVKLDIMPLEVNMEGIAISGFGKGGPGGGGGDGLGREWGGWGTVALPELDNIPMVISAPPIDCPQEVKDQGILEFRVRLHIIIDEVGRAYLVRILQNPFPSTNKEIMEFVSTVIFTPPTRLGVPVRAEYEWPLLID